MVKNGRALSEGAYVIVAPNGDHVIESSEIRALRQAVAIGGSVKFVKWGHSVEATKTEAFDKLAERKPRAKKEETQVEPLPAPVVEAVLTAVGEPAVVEGTEGSDF